MLRSVAPTKRHVVKDWRRQGASGPESLFTGPTRVLAQEGDTQEDTDRHSSKDDKTRNHCERVIQVKRSCIQVESKAYSDLTLVSSDVRGLDVLRVTHFRYASVSSDVRGLDDGATSIGGERRVSSDVRGLDGCVDCQIVSALVSGYVRGLDEPC